MIRDSVRAIIGAIALVIILCQTTGDEDESH